MARKQERKFTTFNLDDSPVVAENERILNAPTTEPSQPNASVAQTAPQMAVQTTPQPTVSEPVQAQPFVGTSSISKARPKKTENGITISVPMEYYERITLMKMRTGIPIRDLALQAVIEYLENHKNY